MEPTLGHHIANGGIAIVEVQVGSQSVGYLVAAAASLDAATAAFIISHTDGFLSVAMECDDLDRLHLPPMVAYCESADGVDYAITVDAIDGVGTGISAHDRARTVRALADTSTVPAELTRPGHVLPVRCGTGGRQGIAESVLALMRFAGTRPLGAFAAILTEQGQIGDHHHLLSMAVQFKLPWIAAETLLRSEDTGFGNAHSDVGSHTSSDVRLDGVTDRAVHPSRTHRNIEREVHRTRHGSPRSTTPKENSDAAFQG
ncbi:MULTISPECIES: 3,4-dihydroxy-2-butanone-4-phosphate synthase [Nocardiaceae]|uniref:3,4-dihydroxy-2-butanone-4-phosphate synthase n=1 Tax=Nocardiaceae TaxID=85025 RepID=UPI0014828919|nr:MULTISPECIES: 3,4-dihydroxy-2-butanone-4-phosphate synthase [Rhodococcus]